MMNIYVLFYWVTMFCVLFPLISAGKDSPQLPDSITIYKIQEQCRFKETLYPRQFVLLTLNCETEQNEIVNFCLQVRYNISYKQNHEINNIQLSDADLLSNTDRITIAKSPNLLKDKSHKYFKKSDWYTIYGQVKIESNEKFIAVGHFSGKDINAPDASVGEIICSYKTVGKEKLFSQETNKCNKKSSFFKIRQNNVSISSLDTCKIGRIARFLKSEPNAYVKFYYYDSLNPPKRVKWMNLLMQELFGQGISEKMVRDTVINHKSTEFCAKDNQKIYYKFFLSGKENKSSSGPELLNDSLYISINNLIDRYLKHDIHGNEIEVDTQKLTLLHFWQTSCIPCLKEMKALHEFVNDYDGKLTIIAISTGWSDSPSQVRLFAKKHQYNFTYAISNELSKKLKIAFIPYNFLIGKRGNILDSFSAFDKKEFKKFIKE